MSHTKEFLDQLVQLGVLSIPDINLDDETALKTFLAEQTLQQRITDFQRAVILGLKQEPLVLDDRYLLCDYVGGGGMGLVYKAFDCRVERTVAIKMLRNVDNLGAKGLERFNREIVALGRLRHPNIIMAYDAGEHQGSPFLVMELVEGRDLGALVADNGPMAVQAALQLMIEAAVGLGYAHSKGVIHRDIKPSNLMLELGDADDEFIRRMQTVKILDLGLARVATKRDLVGDERPEQSLTVVNTTMGTVDYMAPEQASNAKMADHRSDIYSLGCTFYYLLTGRSLYETDNFMAAMLAHVQQPIPSLREIRPDVPEELDAVFAKMVAKNPDDRFQTWKSLIKALDHFAAHSDSTRLPDIDRLIKGYPSDSGSYDPELAPPDTVTEELPSSGSVLPKYEEFPGSSGSRPGPGSAVVDDTDEGSRDDSTPDSTGGTQRVGQTGTIRRTRPKQSSLLPITFAAVAGLFVVLAVLLLTSQQDPPGSALDLTVKIGKDIDQGFVKLLESRKPIGGEKGDDVKQGGAPNNIPNVQLPKYTHATPDAKVRKLAVNAVFSVYYYDRVELSIKQVIKDRHGIEVADVRIPFRLISPDNEFNGSFYMMETEVWNDLFAEFVKTNEDSLTDQQQTWRMGATVGGKPLGVSGPQARLPVLNVHHLDAFRFAIWLGGRLPTKEEWNIAAGCEAKDRPTAGPFQNSKDGQELDIVINRPQGPKPVGEAVDDVSIFGIRDMTGNGAEFTCTAIEGITLTADNYDKGMPPTGLELDFIVRGSHYFSEKRWECTDASRDYPAWSGLDNYITFRVVLEVK